MECYYGEGGVDESLRVVEGKIDRLNRSIKITREQISKQQNVLEKANREEQQKRLKLKLQSKRAFETQTNQSKDNILTPIKKLWDQKVKEKASRQARLLTKKEDKLMEFEDWLKEQQTPVLEFNGGEWLVSSETIDMMRIRLTIMEGHENYPFKILDKNGVGIFFSMKRLSMLKDRLVRMKEDRDRSILNTRNKILNAMSVVAVDLIVFKDNV